MVDMDYDEDSVKEVNIILNNLDIINDIYDMIRIINPLTKKVLYSNVKDGLFSHNNCYYTWNKADICENCIAMRTIKENKTFIKIEYSKDGNIYMITSTITEINQKKFVMELIKNIVGTGIISSIESKNEREIYDFIKEKNDLVVKDELTNIYNRRYIDERLPVDMLNSKINNKPLSLILIDIDHFKRINDTYGHVVGDYTLKEFASKINSMLGKNKDWTARYGGEEFLVVLNNVNEREAFVFAEQIRKGVYNLDLCCNNKCIKVTASLGVYTFNGEDIDFEEIICRVDKNMYEAKRLGRNRTVK
ncbi:GGDEF domain-containing protein [Clostridium rectalis]|uniref:GGDEF domain-containing protein n=1 Tax=Clostridium rectalis TaxID=2040295 RepID=UPI000F633367|nr:GGDEF domain-containing protein [Clostridium rectalis]